MSTPKTKGSSSAVTSDTKSAIGPLQPVPILDTPLARGIAFGRPAILLGLFAAGINSLVDDPVSTLLTSLPVVAAVQIGYAVVAVPPAGPEQAQASRKARPGEKKKNDLNIKSSVIRAIFSLILSIFVIPAVYILFVLFGAPFFNLTAHTILCAAHFSLLAVFPIFYTRGLDRESLITIASASAPLDEAFGALLGAVLGAWLGAIPIPLDWDRDWQRWPVTIVVGMYAGSCLLSLACGNIWYGKRLVETNDDKTD